MPESLKNFVRTAQTYFPFLQETRFRVQRSIRQTLRRPFEHDFGALRLLPDREGDVYLDGGANRGEAIDAILMMRPRARVAAIEPNPVLHRRLQRLFAGDTRVELHNVGLGDEQGEFTLYVPVYNGYVFDGLASLENGSGEEWLRRRLWGFDARKLSIRQEHCRIMRLDDLGIDPFFVKLDIQGYELPALRGGRQTLERARPVLMIETPGEEIVDWLAALGYRPHAYEGGRLVERPRGGLNTFFLTGDRAAEMKR